MCGINGILTPHFTDETEARLRAGMAALRHRGPSAEGIYTQREKGIALGHRRLCIIDLSGNAAQPMSRDERYRMVYNGELYNYVELRAELQQLGYRFTSASDTEVLLAAYAAWGPDCLQRFDGMFAFAIWDEEEQQLFAARDRLGEKPFYFFTGEGALYFASEIKALWDMGLPRTVNRAMLYNFLTLDYTTNPTDATETFFEGIHKLPAASWLTYSLQTREVVIGRYWDIEPASVKDINAEEAVARFRDLLSGSIHRRLRSDVPIGTSLSGGLDSSAVVAFCQQEAAGQYTHRGFTATAPGFEKDEARYAGEVAKEFGLQHRLVSLNGLDVVGLMEAVMAQQDEPVLSASPLAQYKVYEAAARDGVTVLLDGQGADEVLAGYHKYYRWWWRELYARRKLRKSGERRAALDAGVQEPFGPADRLAALLPHFTAGLWQGRRAKQAYRQPDLDRDFAFRHKQQSYYTLPTHPDLNGVLYHNSFVQGLEELLRMADRNSMAHAVEIRLPFLSTALVEFLFSLPPGLKIRQGWTKWLLREAVKDRLPASIVWRRDKIGFEPPQKAWMEMPAVQEAIRAAKQLLVAEGVLDKAVLRAPVRPHGAHAARKQDWKYWSAAFLFQSR